MKVAVQVGPVQYFIDDRHGLSNGVETVVHARYEDFSQPCISVPFSARLVLMPEERTLISGNLKLEGHLRHGYKRISLMFPDATLILRESKIPFVMHPFGKILQGSSYFSDKDSRFIHSDLSPKVTTLQLQRAPRKSKFKMSIDPTRLRQLLSTANRMKASKVSPPSLCHCNGTGLRFVPRSISTSPV
jgi:hypothetical protein